MRTNQPSGTEPTISTSDDSAPVTVLGPETGRETDSVRSAFTDFTENTGIEVDYEASRLATSELDLDIASGTPPDIAFLSQPGRLPGFVKERVAIPASPELADKTTANFNSGLVDLGCFEVPPMFEELEQLAVEMQQTDISP